MMKTNWNYFSSLLDIWSEESVQVGSPTLLRLLERRYPDIGNQPDAKTIRMEKNGIPAFNMNHEVKTSQQGMRREG